MRPATATPNRPKILGTRLYDRGGNTGARYQLSSDFMWLRGLSTEELTLSDILVPKGFITDGASIPRVAWSIIGHPFSGFLDAAVIHDMLYATHNTRADGSGFPVSKAEADALFYYILKDLGYTEMKCRAMYTAVKMFGRKGWSAGGAHRFVGTTASCVMPLRAEIHVDRY